MTYINREDAIEEFEHRESYSATYIRGFLKHLPSADVAPVQHGRWESFEDVFLDTCYECSECGLAFYLADGGTPQENQYHYCPNCGAKMDEEKNNE